MDQDARERVEVWAVGAKLLLTLSPFALLIAFFALYRWIG